MIRVDRKSGKVRLHESIDIEFCFDSMTLAAPTGEVIALTYKELHIFFLLCRRFGETVDKEYLVKKLWRGGSVGNKAFDVHLFNLRKKLARMGVEVHFIPARGYLLQEGKCLEGKGNAETRKSS